MVDHLLFSLGVILFLAGFLIAFVAVILMFLIVTRRKGKAKGGGIVIIGPVPIVFGTDRESIKILLIFSTALFVLVLVTTTILHYS